MPDPFEKAVLRLGSHGASISFDDKPVVEVSPDVYQSAIPSAVRAEVLAAMKQGDDSFNLTKIGCTAKVVDAICRHFSANVQGAINTGQPILLIPAAA